MESLPFAWILSSCDAWWTPSCIPTPRNCVLKCFLRVPTEVRVLLGCSYFAVRLSSQSRESVIQVCILSA